MRALLLCAVLGLPVVTLAAAPPTPPPAADPNPVPPPPPPPASTTAEAECFPQCRSGFFCYQGQCRSACNPPCASGQVCTANGTCEGDAPVDDSTARRTRAGPKGSDVSSDGVKAPPGFHFEVQRRKPMLITGVALFGGGYVLSLLMTSWGYLFAGLGGTSSEVSFANRTRGLYFLGLIPVAGPVLTQVALASSVGYRGDNRFYEYVFTVASTALQVTGIVLAALGFRSRETLVKDEYAASKPPALRFSFAPMAPGAALGFTFRVEN